MADEEFMKALEASPEIELTVTGRTSGREISNPVWFVREGEKLYLVPVRGSDADWYKNVLKAPTIRLAAGGAQLSASASPISDARVGLPAPRCSGLAAPLSGLYPDHLACAVRVLTVFPSASALERAKLWRTSTARSARVDRSGTWR